MGVTRFFIISLLFLASSLQNQISQLPTKINEFSKNSATIQCSVDEETDIRELSLTLRLDGPQLISVKVDKDLSSYTHELTFSGKIRNFTTTANGFNSQEIMDLSNCYSQTCGGERSPDYKRGPGTISCTAKHENIDKMVICLDNHPIILLEVDHKYTDRLRFSGTIRKFHMTLEDLSESDTNGYNCVGKMEDSKRHLPGGETVITITQRGNSHIVSVTWLLILSSLLLIWWC
ncbi:hypothetical protein XELAEV_18044136mg [Xenopus laevis]|nr:hypothetical protein XELAEV_18044136mg [Xenopus laevis]